MPEAPERVMLKYAVDISFENKLVFIGKIVSHIISFIHVDTMAIERTLSIIKPDAVAKNVIGQIVARFEQAGLTVIAARLQQLSRNDAQRFYAVHKDRPFYK
ncbi:nucleoside-diphosphate kinase, partial [Allopusillimonas soli]